MESAIVADARFVEDVEVVHQDRPAVAGLDAVVVDVEAVGHLAAAAASTAISRFR